MAQRLNLNQTAPNRPEPRAAALRQWQGSETRLGGGARCHPGGQRMHNPGLGGGYRPSTAQSWGRRRAPKGEAFLLPTVTHSCSIPTSVTVWPSPEISEGGRKDEGSQKHAGTPLAAQYHGQREKDKKLLLQQAAAQQTALKISSICICPSQCDTFMTITAGTETAASPRTHFSLGRSGTFPMGIFLGPQSQAGA